MKQLYGVSILLVSMIFVNSYATTSASPQAESDKASPDTNQASAKSEQEIRQFMKDWERASFTGDKAWYGRHYADGFIKTDQRGEVVDKKHEVDSITYDRFTKVEASAVDDLKIKIFGDVAVATFKVTIKATTKSGTYNVNSRATSVFVKTSGIWQIVAHHATNMTPAK